MVQLTYWAKRGRGEQVRLLLADLEVPWVDHFVSRGDGSFQALQEEGPGKLAFRSIPMLEDGDFRLVQGPAILGYLARKHALIDPLDLQATARAEAITLGAEDLRIAYFGLFGPEGGQRQRAFVQGAWSDRWLPAFEGLLALNGDTGFFVGRSITHADLAVFDALDATLQWVAGASLDGYPRLERFMDAIRARPRIAAYLASPRRMQG